MLVFSFVDRTYLGFVAIESDGILSNSRPVTGSTYLGVVARI